VPEDRSAADRDERLGDVLRLLPHADAETTTEDHDLHRVTLRLTRTKALPPLLPIHVVVNAFSASVN